MMKFMKSLSDSLQAPCDVGIHEIAEPDPLTLDEIMKILKLQKPDAPALDDMIKYGII